MLFSDGLTHWREEKYKNVLILVVMDAVLWLLQYT